MVRGMTRWRTEELTRAALIDLPRTSLADVREGRLLKVVGRVELLDPIVSPLAKRPCAAYSVKLQEKVTTFDSLIHVVESASRDFVLRDGSGYVVVRAANASIFWEHAVELRGALWQDRATAEIRAFLRRHDLPSTDCVGELPYRFSEGVVADGTELTLIGRARREIDVHDAAVFREPLTRVVFEAATDPLVLIDGPTRWRLR
jgi:hypothetical protein